MTITQLKPLFISPIRLLETDELYLDFSTKDLLKVVRDGVVIWEKYNPNIFIDAEFERELKMNNEMAIEKTIFKIFSSYDDCKDILDRLLKGEKVDSNHIREVAINLIRLNELDG